jgi:Ca2+-binding RTX toxin-like protein
MSDYPAFIGQIVFDVFGTSGDDLLESPGEYDVIFHPGGGADTLVGTELGLDLFDFSEFSLTGVVVFADGQGNPDPVGDNDLLHAALAPGTLVLVDSENTNDQIGNIGAHISGIEWFEFIGDNITIQGGMGSDTIFSASGQDRIIYGNDGNDYLSYEVAVKITEIKSSPTIIYGGNGSDTILGSHNPSDLGDYNTLYGGADNDSITIYALHDYIYGDGGDDIITLVQSNNIGFDSTIYGGQGDDTIISVTSYSTDAIVGNTIYGGDGNDVFRGNNFSGTTYGGAGIDIYIGDYWSIYNHDINGELSITEHFYGVEIYYAGNYNDRVTGIAEADTIYGEGGNDTIGDSGSSDYADGGAGLDWLSFKSRTNAIRADLSQSNFTDSFGFENTALNFEAVYGGSGNDLIIGNELANTLIGGAGADTIQGLGGTDSITGGAGADLLIVGAADRIADFAEGDRLRIDSGANASLTASSHTDGTMITLDGVSFLLEGVALSTEDFEQIGLDWQLRPSLIDAAIPLPTPFPGGSVSSETIGNGATVITVTRSAAADNMEIRTIQPGSASVSGIALTDDGSTQLDLGQGLGAVSYGPQTPLSAAAAITMLGTLGITPTFSDLEVELSRLTLDPDLSGNGTVIFRYLDLAGEVVSGSALTIDLTTASASGGIQQVALIDFSDIAGVAASVGGFDRMMILGSGSIISETGNAVIRADSHAQLFTLSIGNDTLYAGGGIDTAYGGDGADLIYGNQANDRLYGGDGADTMFGGQDADQMLGNTGTDILYGNFADDLVYGNQGNDTLFGGQDQDTLYGGQDADWLHGNLGDDILYGNFETDILYGNAGNDMVFGGQGDDVMFGNDGNDWLIGGRGDDSMFGGAGADRFDMRFGASGEVDVIYDYQAAAGDSIVLRTDQAAVIAATTTADGLNLQLDDRLLVVLGISQIGDIVFEVL